MRCSFSSKSDFGSIHAINARVPARCAARGHNNVAGQETELHQTSRDVLGEIQMIEHAGFALWKLSERTRKCVVWRSRVAVIDTHLQHHKYLTVGFSTSSSGRMRRNRNSPTVYWTFSVVDTKNANFFARDDIDILTLISYTGLVVR